MSYWGPSIIRDGITYVPHFDDKTHLVDEIIPIDSPTDDNTTKIATKMLKREAIGKTYAEILEIHGVREEKPKTAGERGAAAGCALRKNLSNNPINPKTGESYFTINDTGWNGEWTINSVGQGHREKEI